MRRVLNAISTPTARSTMVYYVGTFGQNILRYFFHLVLLKLLAPAEYGEFLSYLSLTYLLGVPMGTISTVVTKFVSDFRGRGDDTSINEFFYYILRKTTPIIFGLGLLLIIFSGGLAGVFKAHSLAFIVLGASMLISLYQSIALSYLVALQKFVYQTVIGFLSVLVTILLAVFFISLGFGATGAVIAQLVTAMITTVVVFWGIRKNIYPQIPGKKTKFTLTDFTGYSFINSLGVSALMSVDILVVRAIFDSHTSGLYSALSILGRMILFGLTPIINIVLPIATHRHASTGSAKSILYKLGVAITFLGLIGAGIFTVFSQFIVRTLSGTAYLEVASLLPVFAFTMVFFALTQFVVSYLMAIGKPKINILLLASAAIQPLVIFLSRGSLSTVVWSLFTLHLFLSITVFAYTTTMKHS